MKSFTFLPFRIQYMKTGRRRPGRAEIRGFLSIQLPAATRRTAIEEKRGKMKKLLTLLLSLIFSLSLCALPMYAAETAAPDAEITITNTQKGHIYTAYQIFTGQVTGAGNTGSTLDDIEFGSSVPADKQAAFLNTLNQFSTGSPTATDAATAAVKISRISSDRLPALAEAISADLGAPAGTFSENTDKSSYSLTGVADGYYLITDEAGTNAPDTNTYSRLMLNVAGNVTISPKAGNSPTLRKQVRREDGTMSNAAGYEIGEKIPFTLSVTLPDNYSVYQLYDLVVSDTMANGLSYVPDSLTIEEMDANNKLQPITFAVQPDVKADGQHLVITFADLKKADPALTNSNVLVFSYEAVLNENADITSKGNLNSAQVTFSNTPDVTDRTAKTPVSTAKVYTTSLQIDKVDENARPLAGAVFTLQKENADGTYSDVNLKETETPADDPTTFTFKGLGPGNYQLTETTAPTGYCITGPVRFTVQSADAGQAIYDADGARTALTCRITQDPEHSVKVATDADTGVITFTYTNKSQSTLPSTGSIGMLAMLIAGIAIFGFGYRFLRKNEPVNGAGQ